MSEAKVSKLQKKLASAMEKLSPETLVEIQVRIKERDARIPAALAESRARDEVYYARQGTFSKEERDEMNRLMEQEEKAMEVRTQAFAAYAESIRKRRKAKAQIIIYGAVSSDRLTYHAAERMDERGISTLDVSRERVTVIKRSDISRNVIITTYGEGSLLNGSLL